VSRRKIVANKIRFFDENR